MRAIAIIGQGEAARLILSEAPDPRPAADEVLIDVAATAVNRADLLQRKGLYPPPAGASQILGLECSGIIRELGADVKDWSVGDEVCALLPGGGYAERAVAHPGSMMRVPNRLTLTDAAAVPEVFLTCSLNLFQIAEAPAVGWALVHGGGSGIGTAAIQLLRHAGVKTIVTAGSTEKCNRCLDLGAVAALNYRHGDFTPEVMRLTEGQGVDVVLDSIGAPYLAQHLKCLAVGGRLILIGLMGGAVTEINLGTLLAKRIAIHGSTLRSRSVEEKARIVTGFLQRFKAALDVGTVRPIIHTVLPLEEAQAAHEILEESSHFGKVVLQVQTDLT